ncbi:hypothetical protein AHAS_Ahas19G0273600 [Arachis hypogaea]
MFVLLKAIYSVSLWLVSLNLRIKAFFSNLLFFLIGQLFLRSFVGQVQVTSPLRFLRLSKNIRSGAYNEIEFPQFRFILKNSCQP